MQPKIPPEKTLFETVAIVSEGKSYALELDGKKLKLPSGKILSIASKPLAEIMAEEWRAIKEKINLLAMPYTRLVMGIAECTPEMRAEKMVNLLSYAGTDLLCYREPFDAALISRQDALWNPWIEWMKQEFNFVLPISSGIMPSEEAIEISLEIKQFLTQLPDARLLILEQMVGITGSLVLGVALLEQKITVPEAVAAANLDEDYQREKWGEDKEAALRRREIGRELEVLSGYLRLAASGT